jgi:hypothetical protein
VCDGGEKRRGPDYVCDQQQDCVDGTDEQNCKK